MSEEKSLCFWFVVVADSDSVYLVELGWILLLRGANAPPLLSCYGKGLHSFVSFGAFLAYDSALPNWHVVLEALCLMLSLIN